MCVEVLSGFISEPRKGGSVSVSILSGYAERSDPQFANPGGHNGTIEYELARERDGESDVCLRLKVYDPHVAGGLAGYGKIDRLVREQDLPLTSDFRDEIDPLEHVIRFPDHPECGCDEVFLGNVSWRLFAVLRWKTKRLGKKALTPRGKPLKKGWYPLFVKIEELIQDGVSLEHDTTLIGS